MGRTRSTDRGFTLTELLVIFVILGVLAAIVAPQFSSAAVDARANGVQAHLTTLEVQLELFRARNGRYPTLTELAQPPGDGARGGSFGVLIDQRYLEAAPVNPLTGGDTVGVDWLYDEATGRVTPVGG